MFDDEDDCGCDDESEKTYVVAKRKHKWLILSACLEVLADIFMAFHKLFSTLEESTLQKFTHENDRLKFMEQAAREIESLTSGGLDATTKPTSAG